MFVYKYLFKVYLQFKIMDFSDENLKGLLRRIQKEEGVNRERATSEFLKFYYPMMKKYFHGYFEMTNKEEVKDLCQNILLRIIKNNINIKGNVRGYFFIVAKNTFLNYIKPKYKLFCFEELSEDLQSSDSIYHPGVLLDYKIKENLFYKHHKKIRGEKVQERFQFWLSGASHEEISKRDRICVGSSKSILFHIRDVEGAIFFEEPNERPYRS